jgi:hypothetical protein
MTVLTLEELEPRLALAAHGTLPAVTNVVFRNGTLFINPPRTGEVVTVSEDDNGILTVSTSHKETWRFSEDQIQQIVYTGHGRGQFTNESSVQADADGGGGRSVLVGQQGDVLTHARGIEILPAPQDDQSLSATGGFIAPGGGVVAQTPQQFFSLLAGVLPPQQVAAWEARFLQDGNPLA